VRALDGIRVLDLTHMLSGPYCGMMLADLGAETIKIEPPGIGEGTRRLLADDPEHSRHDMGAYFLTLNRNKKSVCLDLKNAEGKALFFELVAVSDIVLTNFSVGVCERLGIDHARLASHNPRVITCSISGFGETGPNRDWTAFDIVAQGTGGGMSVTGPIGGDPLRAGLPIGDLGGGSMAIIGVLAALQARHRTGRGQHVDISMQDAQVSWLGYMATMFGLSGRAPGKEGNAHFVHVPYGTFPAKDGFIIIAVIYDAFWKPLLEITGLSELDTEENAVRAGRFKNRESIVSKLGGRLREENRDFWLTRLRAARIPSAPVNDIAETVSDPHVLARNMIVDVALTKGGTVRMPGNPIKLSETYEDVFTSPPVLGEHTDAVLRDLLGKTKDQIDAWKSRGVVG
jgi:crotonobetainyl-CoA:carnitine CoA-transferase CaiB-like acyl-CoA transferase